MNDTRFRLLSMPLSIALLIGMLLPGITFAQTNDRFIEVSASATITKAPNLAQIKVAIVGVGESAKLASKAFGKKHQRFMDSMGPMNFPNTEIQAQRPNINSDISDQMMEMMNGPFGEEADQEVEQKFECREMIILETEIDEDPKKMLTQISRIIDGCSDADADLGGRTIASMYSGESADPFVVLTRSDRDEIEQECQGQAFENAKLKATALAKLAGGKIGKVITITSSQDHEAYLYGVYGLNQTSAQFKVTATLQVRFELID